MKIILIPGLGYNCRIFENLNLTNLDIEYLNWIEPKNGEILHDYSQRLFSKIKKTSKKIILIGHSLGGIVSQEIASVNKIEKIILLSSIKSRKEMPFSFKIVKPLLIDKLFTKELSLKTIRFWGKNHGFDTEDDKALFKSMVEKQTNKYLQWALRELSIWQEPEIPNHTKLAQIHGTKDKTFPFKLIDKPNFIIKNGTHNFVYKQAEKTTEILHREINQVLNKIHL
jgi:pimeloyl-ACP methyl ester carboxylesterase